MKPSVTLTHDALGTRFYIEIFDEVPVSFCERLTHDTGQLLAQFEARYSRFKSDSLVSILNRDRLLTNPDAECIAILKYGQTLTKRTGGRFNMLLGKTLEARGYDPAYSFIPTMQHENESTLPDPLTDLHITDSAITLHNGQLDLGGFGKGYVIDRLAQFLRDTYHLQYFIINGGGDIYATSQHGEPFTIYLEHPLEAETYLGATQILNQGFAASSPHKRSWVYNNTTYHHIINTTQDSLSKQTLADASFIIADSCVEADAFATIALMLETTDLPLFAEEHTLAYATFTAPSTLIHNEAFIVQTI